MVNIFDTIYMHINMYVHTLYVCMYIYVNVYTCICRAHEGTKKGAIRNDSVREILVI
jgi:hypothetical protein